MKNKLLLYTTIALFIGIIFGYFITQLKQIDTKNQTLDKNYKSNADQSKPSRENCLADDCLSVENFEYPAGNLSSEAKDALNEAINDEYKALTTYQSVIAKFGMIRPFSMIKGAEEQHIASLKAIYDKYGLNAPENMWTGKITVPDSLQQACQIGVDAEIANAALYREKLLPAVKEYQDIYQIFTNLMNASEQKHLTAFEKCN